MLGQCDAVLTGYVGEAETGAAILDAVARVKAANPAALWCCDPVIGDVGPGVYVRTGIPEFFRDRALALADIATPNQFELEWLTGRRIATLADAKAAVGGIAGAAGRAACMLTSLRTAETPAAALDLLAAEGGAAWRVRTPLLPIAVNGAGDAIAALFLFHRLRCGSARVALERAAALDPWAAAADRGGRFARIADRRGAGGIRRADHPAFVAEAAWPGGFVWSSKLLRSGDPHLIGVRSSPAGTARAPAAHPAGSPPIPPRARRR